MTVQELINELAQLDRGAEVRITVTDNEATTEIAGGGCDGAQSIEEGAVIVIGRNGS